MVNGGELQFLLLLPCILTDKIIIEAVNDRNCLKFCGVNNLTILFMIVNVAFFEPSSTKYINPKSIFFVYISLYELGTFIRCFVNNLMMYLVPVFLQI